VTVTDINQPDALTGSKRLAEKLTGEGGRTMEFFRGLTPDQWEQVIYSEGKEWKVRQVLAHFVSSEAANRQVVENILGGGPGAPVVFDINKFNEEKVAELLDNSVEELLVQFVMLRQATIDLVRRMDDIDLGKQGRHPFFGIASVEDILKLIYRNNQIHLRDVRKMFGP